MRLHGEALEAAHRTPPPRATLERLAKRIADATVSAATGASSFVSRNSEVTGSAPYSLSLHEKQNNLDRLRVTPLRSKLVARSAQQWNQTR
jgi:hypothetical protein